MKGSPVLRLSQRLVKEAFQAFQSTPTLLRAEVLLLLYTERKDLIRLKYCTTIFSAVAAEKNGVPGQKTTAEYSRQPIKPIPTTFTVDYDSNARGCSYHN